MAASSSAHRTEIRYLLDAGTLYYGEETENTPPLDSSLVSSNDDKLAVPILDPSNPATDDPEEPGGQICKWKLRHRTSITRGQANNEQVHTATMQYASSPSSPPPTAASWANFPFGAFKTPASQPSAHCYLPSPPTPSRVRLDEDTTISMPDFPCPMPNVIAVGRGRGCPPHRRPKLKFRPRHIGGLSPLHKKMRCDEWGVPKLLR